MTNPSPLGSLEHSAPPTHRPTTLKRDSQEFAQIERSLAYSSCEQEIRSACNTVEEDDLTTWYDLETRDWNHDQLDDAVAYLEARTLLKRHPEHPHWVMVFDEESDLIDVFATPPTRGPQQNCAQDMVLAKHPHALVVRSMFGLVVQDQDTDKLLGAGRMPAYWHEEAWMNAVEELEGR